MTLIAQSQGSVLCPMLGVTPQHPRHREAVLAVDSVYKDTDRFPRDSNGNLIGGDEAEQRYRAAESQALRDIGIYSATPPEYMNLYCGAATTLPSPGHSGYGVAEAWWFQCPTCSCILPANYCSPTRGR